MFNKHEGSAMHKAAVDVIITIPKSCSNVGVMLLSEHALQNDNHKYILQIFLKMWNFYLDNHNGYG